MGTTTEGTIFAAHEEADWMDSPEIAHETLEVSIVQRAGFGQVFLVIRERDKTGLLVATEFVHAPERPFSGSIDATAHALATR